MLTIIYSVTPTKDKSPNARMDVTLRILVYHVYYMCTMHSRAILAAKNTAQHGSWIIFVGGTYLLFA